MKTLKEVLEDIIMTSNVANASNLVGTKSPKGGFIKPGRLPFSKQKGGSKLKKKAMVNSLQARTMNPDPNHPGSPFAISPAEWVDEKPKKKKKNEV